MGKERETKRKHIFLYGACILAILLSGTGCGTTLNIQKRWQGLKHLDLAEELINKGDYEGALNEDQEVVRLFPAGSLGDRALFQMAIILAHPDNPKKNYLKALECFQRVVHDYPNSKLRREAIAWTGAIKALIHYETRIKDLEGTISDFKKQLHALKEIDIGIEEKKREDLPGK